MADLDQHTSMDGPAPDDCLLSGTQMMNGQYTISRYLSSGGFGITYLAKDSLNRDVVIKECYAETFCTRRGLDVVTRTPGHASEFDAFRESFMREAHSIAKLDHPNIVGVHHVFEANNTAYMALDLVKGRDLLDILEDPLSKPEPRVIRELLIKLLDAIDLVHAQDMLHRDISPDNILLTDENEPVLIDFGNAREEVSKKSRAMSALLVVKDGYSPQEFYIAGSRQLECSDLYALAATFYHVITGEAPPNSQVRLLAKGRSEPDPYQPLNGRIIGYSPIFLETIDKAMELFPTDRIQSAKEWMARIDTRKRREIAIAKAKTDEGIEKTVHELLQNALSEAQQQAAPSRPAAPAKKPRLPSARPLRPQRPKTAHPFPELATLPEGELPPIAPPELPPTPPKRMVAQRKETARPSSLRRSARVLLIAAAVSVYVSTDSAHNLMELGAPYVQHVLNDISERLPLG